MSKYKHLLFDVDGTLVDSFNADMSSLLELMNRHRPGHGKSVEDLIFAFGIPGRSSLRILGFSEEEIPKLIDEWIELAKSRADECTLFDGATAVLRFLQERGFRMGVITSRSRHESLGGTLGDFIPEPLTPYIRVAVCASDVEHPKPAPDSILRYMEITGAKRDEILFIGDAPTDLQCADAAGVDFALAQWGYHGRKHLRCAHYLRTLYDVIALVSREEDFSLGARMHEWAREINSIGQTGLAFSQDVFDRERFERLREIACEMAACYADADADKIRKNWCADEGYKTPKIDTRAAIFDEMGRLLMVRERRTGKWNMPGGWCDENLSLCENTVKEVYEEAGRRVCVRRLVALLDRNRHNSPKSLSGCVKVFFECSLGEGEFQQNNETSECGFFTYDEISAMPEGMLRLGTNTLEQIRLCFEAHDSDRWEPVVE